MPYLDPTRTRLSKSLLLSDAMGCTSVYRDGFRNRFDRSWCEQLSEGRHLANTLDDISGDLIEGPFSICYGFVSPELSRNIVKYQNPDLPSYHRWDHGAAMDVCFHRFLESGTPIRAAHAIDQDGTPYSRIITYAESEWICIATRLSEQEAVPPRRALYENRYVGEKKPVHIKYSNNPHSRIQQIESHTLPCDWRGRGWPSYHGSGLRQFEHYRVSRYTHVIDFLYDKHLVHKGVKNTPPILNKEKFNKWLEMAYMAGHTIDVATRHNGGNRPSITQAYNMHVPSRNWSRRFTLQMVPAKGYHPDDLAHAIQPLPGVSNVSVVHTSIADISLINVLGEDLLCL